MTILCLIFSKLAHYKEGTGNAKIDKIHYLTILKLWMISMLINYLSLMISL